MIKAILKRLTGKTFWKLFALILVPEAATLSATWFLLDANANGWISDKAQRAIWVSQQAARSGAWSLIDSIPKDKTSALFDRYADRLEKLSKRYFLRDDGSVYLAIVDQDTEYDIATGNTMPVDNGKANSALTKAYATKKLTYLPGPISDDSGTYIAAFTPIVRNGKTIGLVAAEYDSAPLSVFQATVRTAFLYSSVPAIITVACNRAVSRLPFRRAHGCLFHNREREKSIR